MCGSNRLPWENIREAILCLYIKPKSAYTFENLYENLRVLYNLCIGKRDAGFHNLVDWTRHSSCSDPRDRLYAPFSLLCPAEKMLAIESDYTKSTSQVFLEFAQRHINSTKSLNILKHVEMDEEISTSKS
jgi:hypothetical protein